MWCQNGVRGAGGRGRSPWSNSRLIIQESENTENQPSGSPENLEILEIYPDLNPGKLAPWTIDQNTYTNTYAHTYTYYNTLRGLHGPGCPRARAGCLPPNPTPASIPPQAVGPGGQAGRWLGPWKVHVYAYVHLYIARSEGFLCGIFGPWARWIKALARWESCWDAVVAAVAAVAVAAAAHPPAPRPPRPRPPARTHKV